MQNNDYDNGTAVEDFLVDTKVYNDYPVYYCTDLIYQNEFQSVTTL